MKKLWLLICLALAGCVENNHPPPAGQVFAGPAELILREDINPKSKASGTVHHGDKLDVLQQRRRMYRVRAASGAKAQGWTDERNLMSIDRMQALAQLEEQVRRWPSQGAATTFEILNVHTEAQRFSPSFITIKPGETFDVMAHQISPRAEPSHRILVKAQPRTDANRKGGQKSKKAVLPAVPPPPGPPTDWVELSKQRQPDAVEESKARALKQEQKEQAPQDDWTLIRTSRGAAGWVLTGRIFLSIPDEVAQYAEGHRILTYYSLGRVHDTERGMDKETWLWTTVRAGVHPYDFDNVRVFEWNAHRHRYETAYIHKEVEGFLPVVVRKTDAQVTFSVCLTDDDGAKRGFTYSLVDYRVHAAGVGECAKPETATEVHPETPAPPRQETPSFTQRLKDRAGAVKRKIAGK